jgi:hypothetical protein
VPFGVRSLRVTSPATLPPSPIVVERANQAVADGQLNFRTGAEAVTYTAGTAKIYNGNLVVVATLKSTYSTAVQASTITVSWAGGGTCTAVGINGILYSLATPVSSGSAITIGPTMVVPANSGTNSLEMQFSTSKSGVALTVVFAWVNRLRTDTITFTP